MSDNLVRQIVDFIRTYEFGHGDQYGSYIGTSPDAEEIARAVEANFVRFPYKSPEGNNPKGPRYL